ncbi:MAG: glycerate kinase [Chloroflexi bacterium]|nr:MAG: glycerate kinase [Chloroflexota bacterium]
MKIVIAPNEFKGSLSALKVAVHIQRGIQRVLSTAQCELYPVADGGDGTLDVIMHNLGGEVYWIPVLNPLGILIQARLGIIGQTAIIEMAEASGLRLLTPDQLNPMRTTTYGTGQLILAALDHGCKRIIIGLGGSATVDGGLGMAQALGVKLLDDQGNQIPYGGQGLLKIKIIDMSLCDPRLKEVSIQVACDVTNPLLGEAGAARVFAPQKGATPEMVKMLEYGFLHFADLVEQELGKAIGSKPFGGAAGGLAAGLFAFLGADLISGADLILDIIDLEDHIKDADLIITGEGRIDNQTQYGKAPLGVLRLGQKHGIPVVALTGSVSGSHEFDAIMPIVDSPQSLDEAIKNAPQLIEHAAERMMRFIQLGRTLTPIS